MVSILLVFALVLVSYTTLSPTKTVYSAESVRFFAFKEFQYGVDLEPVDSKGGTITHSLYNGDGKVCFKTSSGEKSDSYADMTLNGIAQTDRYVAEVEITPVKVDSGSYIGIFDSKKSGSWRMGVDLKAGGDIVAQDSVKGKVTVGKWQANVPVVMSLCYRVSEGKYDVYLDGSLAMADLNCASVYSDVFRIDMYKSSSSGDIEFYIDDIRVYSGDAPIRDLPNLLTFYNNTFEDELGLSRAVGHGGYLTREESYGSNMARFYAPAGEVCIGYSDVNAPLVTSTSRYTIETDVIPVSVGGSSYIGLYDAKDSNNKWRMGTKFHSDGTIKITNAQTGSQEKIGNWQSGKRYRMSYIYDTVAGTVDVFINGSIVRGGLPCTDYAPYIFRIDMNNKSGNGNLEFYIDNIRIYNGTYLYPEDSFENTEISIMDQSVGVISLLGDQRVYGVNVPYYFGEGKKQSYPSKLHQPIKVGDEAYVSEEFVTDMTDVADVSALAESADALSMNGTVYISASRLAEALGKEYYFDPRGYFVMSDETFPYKDGDHFRDMFEVGDYIYRYLCFDNPEGEDIIADMANTVGLHTHPRILYTREEVEYIQSQDSPTWTSAKLSAMNSAEASLTAYDGVLTPDCIPADKQSMASTFQTAMERLATGYLLSGDERYAAKGVELMMIMAQWQSLSLDVANLTTGHWAMGMAIGYDTFYEYMMSDSEGREDMQFIKDAIIRMPFADTIGAYRGGGGAKWINIRDNFMGVIGGGMLALVLAMAHEEDIRDKIVYLGENLIKSLEIATCLYYPNGGYYEGVGYSDYMMGNLSKGMEALWRCCGTDYSLGNVEGFDKAGAFFVYMQSTKSKLNFHDCGGGFSTSTVPFWLAYRYPGEDSAKIAKLWMNQHVQRGSGLSLYNLYFADRAIGCEASTADMPLDNYFYNSDAGSFRDTFDSDNQTFVGFHGGYNGLPHDMLDLGEFVFEALGVQWAIDLGSDDYDLPSYFGTEGYKIYRKNPQGENCLVINPKDNQDSDGNMTWYGQNLKANAPRVLFESAPRGAMAAYDLTEAYDRDVTEYTRGYYFGDDRNTLLVQDELTLRGDSEIYWFMHTKAKIEIIDDSTARLTQNGQTLVAKLLCTESGAAFSVMDPVPFEYSPFVEGQAVNTGVSKLTVHIPQAEADVKIAVKLIPQSRYYDATDVQDISIDEWTLPEGEILYDFRISGINCTKNNLLSVDLQMPSDVIGADLYIDGRYACRLPADVGRFTTDAIDISYLADGSHLAEVVITDSEGNTLSKSARFEFEKSQSNVFFEHSLTNYGGEITTMYKSWKMGASGKVKADGSYIAGLKLCNTEPGQMWLDMRCSSVDALSSMAVVLEFDVEFSSYDGALDIECRSGSGAWFMSNTQIFEYGNIADGTRYELNRPYHVRLVVDTAGKECIIYVDGKEVHHGMGIASADSLGTIKIQYTSNTRDQFYILNNLKITRHTTVPKSVSVRLERTEDESVVTFGAERAGVKARIVLAAYEGNRLEDVAVHHAASDTDGFSLSIPVDTSHPCEYFKVFALSGENSVVPLGRSYYYYND